MNIGVYLIRIIGLFLVVGSMLLIHFHRIPETTSSIPLIGNKIPYIIPMALGTIFLFPQYYYITPMFNFAWRQIRMMVFGRINVDQAEILSLKGEVISLNKKILSLRREIKDSIVEMLNMSASDNLETYYFSQITMDEISYVLTSEVISKRERNLLLVLIGLRNLMPLLKTPDFLISIIPLQWRKYGSTILAVTIAALLGNLVFWGWLSSVVLWFMALLSKIA